MSPRPKTECLDFGELPKMVKCPCISWTAGVANYWQKKNIIPKLVYHVYILLPGTNKVTLPEKGGNMIIFFYDSYLS